jgi:hypothetical protein
MFCRSSNQCLALWLLDQPWGKLRLRSTFIYFAKIVHNFKWLEDSFSLFLMVWFQCLENPLRPQYNGGIIVNPELNDGLRAWSTFGDAKTEHRESNGNKYVVAHSRNNPYGSMSQKLYLKKNHLYTFSGMHCCFPPPPLHFKFTVWY